MKFTLSYNDELETILKKINKALKSQDLEIKLIKEEDRDLIHYELVKKN